MTHPADNRRRGLATAVGLVVGATAFLLTLLDYGTQLTRTANALGYASNFFDFQGRALLDGRLYVPDGSLGIEGFVERGHEYMYFPPWPAILRMPILSTTHEYDGRLTLLSMALGFVLLLVMAPKLVWLVRDMLSPGVAVGRVEAVSMATLLALITGGTTLTYVASLPWAYHEVYAWAIPFAVGAMYWMLRVLRDPRPATIAWLLAFDLGTIMTRTTGGWAMCLVTIAIGGLMLLGRMPVERRRTAWMVVAAGALPLALGIAINLLKFRHPFLFPLEDQVWTKVNGHRREALAVNGGTITGPQFLPSSFMAYFRLDGIRFVDYFPWITVPATPARAYNGAFIDQTYRTGSVTAFMPWLLALTALATLTIFRPGVDATRKLLRFPLVAGVLITGGVMGYGYISFRYTSEFVPALIMGGTIGTCLVTRWLRRRSRPVKAIGLAVAAVAAAFSIVATMLTGYAAAAMTGGGARLQAYLAQQHRWSPDQQARLITRGDSLPAGGHADDLWVRGDCDAVYLNTGDRYDPWVVVERRAQVWSVTLPAKPIAGRIKLVTIQTNNPGSIWLETDHHGQSRVELVNETGTYYGPWFGALAPRDIRVGVLDEPDLGYARVSSNPGGWVGYVRTYDWGHDWIARLVDIEPAYTPGDLRRLGLTVRPVAGLEPPLCREITADRP